MHGPIVELLDGDSLPYALDKLHSADIPVLMLVISRREVDTFNIGSAVDRLMSLSDTKARTLRLANSMHLVMQGFDDDPRELYMIPECVRFVRALAGEWNFWLHFTDLEGDSLGVLLRMLVDIEPQFTTDGRAYIALSDPDQLPRAVAQLFLGLNALYAQYGFAEALLEQRSTDVNAAIERMFAR